MENVHLIIVSSVRIRSLFEHVKDISMVVNRILWGRMACVSDNYHLTGDRAFNLNMYAEL